MLKIQNIITVALIVYTFLVNSIAIADTIESDSADSTKKILLTYGRNDLSTKPPFQGGYINFGYWKNITLSPKKKITQEERISSSLALYKLIIDQLEIKRDEKVLEVGCGLGMGCKYALDNYQPSNLNCIDITPEQIARAKKIHKESVDKDLIQFEVASADNINKVSASFDKIYSVEAVQYFPSILKFANEAWRLLKPNGLLIITAHFSTNEKGYLAAKNLLPTVAQDIDRMIPIDQVREAFKIAGFTEVKFEPIGAYVFEGFDRWITQINDEPWAHNIYQLYLDGHINYYVLVLRKN